MVFFEQAFKEIYPRTEFLPNWHMDAIVNCLERAIGGGLQKQIINLPPRPYPGTR